jgi:hypothetical protein
MIPRRPVSNGNEPRWLSPESAAAYIGVRVDQLPRLLREGKIPRPSYHLGPRRARYDREAIDAVFSGTGHGRPDNDRIEQAQIIETMLSKARLKGRSPHKRG